MEKIKQLFDCLVGRNIPAEFANENVDYEAALRDAIKELCPDYRAFRHNKQYLFDLMEENVDIVLPRKVEEYLSFAEIAQFGNNDAIRYRRRVGHSRGKTYVTRATAAGNYETFRLDNEIIELTPKTYGGAGYVDFERYLDGTEDLMEIYDILIEGLMDRIYEDVSACLIASYNDTARPAANKATSNGLDTAKLSGLIQTVQAYGAPVIYCSVQFAAKLVNVITDGTNYKMSATDVEEYRQYGYIGRFAGAPVVVLPNTFKDETNAKLVNDPRYAFVIPAGKEKLVKVAMIGDTQIKSVDDNSDWSMAIHMYKKMAVGMVAQPNFWGIYYDSSINY